MKVYAIHTGCIFEGGGVKDIYADKERAIKFALLELEERKKEAAMIYDDEDDAENWEWKEIASDEYTIEGIASGIVKMWQNPVDEIIIYEYELK